MLPPHFNHFFPTAPVDASHPDILLDLNRCILCELCVRATRDVDGKDVFALGGRGIAKHLIVNAESGRLADTDLAAADKAATSARSAPSCASASASRCPSASASTTTRRSAQSAAENAPRHARTAP